MIRPTSKCVLLQWVPKGEIIAILLPDGVNRPTVGGDFVVQAVGPDVPQIPKIEKGTKVLLRPDTAMSGVDEKKKLGIIHYDYIMAVVSDDPEIEMTGDQIREIAGN